MFVHSPSRILRFRYLNGAAGDIEGALSTLVYGGDIESRWAYDCMEDEPIHRFAKVTTSKGQCSSSNPAQPIEPRSPPPIRVPRLRIPPIFMTRNSPWELEELRAKVEALENEVGASSLFIYATYFCFAKIGPLKREVGLPSLFSYTSYVC